MTTHRFDALIKILATRLSRRSAMQATGLGLATSVIGMQRLPALAQDSSPVASPSGDCVSLGQIEKEAMATRFFTEGLAQGNLDVIDEIYAPDGRHNAAFFPVAPNPQAIKNVLAGLRSAFPDIEVAIDDVFGDGDFVVVRWTDTGSFTAEVQGFPPTGEKVSWSGINIFQFTCGRISESWAESDTLTQLGLGLDTGSAVQATPDAGATPASDCVDGSEDANVAIAVKWFDVWNSKDVSLYEALVTPDTIHHFGLQRDSVGLTALQDGVTAFFTAFPDLVHTDKEIIADGDLVVIRFSHSGTFTGPFLGTNPTGVKVIWSGINIFRFECGVVAESWSEVSGLDLWRQLGIVDAPGATPVP